MLLLRQSGVGSKQRASLHTRFLFDNSTIRKLQYLINPILPRRKFFEGNVARKFRLTPRQENIDRAHESSKSKNQRNDERVKLYSLERKDLNPKVDYIVNNAATLSRKGKTFKLVKNLLENAYVPKKLEILKNLKPGVSALCKHEIGGRVILTALKQERLLLNEPEYNSCKGKKYPIISIIYSKAIELSWHRYGYLFICKFLKQSTIAERSELISEFFQPTLENKILVGEIIKDMETYKSPVPILACNQYASRVLQEVCRYGTKQERTALLSLTSPKAFEISMHESGSYFLKNCWRMVTKEDRLSVFNELLQPTGRNEVYFNHLRAVETTDSNPVAFLACHDYSSRVLQRIVEDAGYLELKRLHASLRDRAMIISLNRRGNYVMQSYLKKATTKHVREIIEQLLRPSGKNKAHLNTLEAHTKSGMNSAVALACDEYGCHVLQDGCNHVNADEMELLHSLILPRVLEIALAQFGCLSMIKLLEVSTPVQRSKLVEKLARPSGENKLYFETVSNERMNAKDSFTLLARDEYGRHVLDAVSKCGSDEEAALVGPFLLSTDPEQA